MQTFLPYADFLKSAKCLDRQRLGKQRVECLQILKALDGGKGWANHPATVMWRGFKPALAEYGLICSEVWMARGYEDTCQYTFQKLIIPDYPLPPWLGNEAFHASHRSNLLRKKETYYRQFGWTEPTNLPYIWPVVVPMIEGIPRIFHE